MNRTLTADRGIEVRHLSAQKLPQDLVDEILRRGLDEDAASIARDLNLRRLEVVAILAHRGIESKRSQGAAPEALELVPAKDLGIEPTPKSESETEQDFLLDESEPGSQAIYLGEDEFDTPAWWTPGQTKEVNNPHLMIMGESGSGKTYAVQCIIAELARAGMPSIVFDYGQGFESDKLDPTFVKYCEPQQHLIGEVGLGLNPFQIFPQDARGPNNVATRLADAFDAAFRLGDIQKKVFVDAVLRAYGRAGIVANDRKTWSNPPPTLNVLSEVIDELAADREGYANQRNAASLAARLQTFFMLVAIGEKQWSWDKIISGDAGRVHILQFRGLEGKTRRVLVELLLWHMFFYFKSRPGNAGRVFCVLDEAHQLSFRETGPIDSLLREARKFGLGIIFASQQPQDFSPVAYSNTATKLVFQTADPDLKVSKFLSSKSQNYDDPSEIRDIIATLPQGQAFLITKNRGKTIRVSDFSKRATQWTN